MAHLLALHEEHRQSQLIFCSAFRAALPREVRDMVYDHLITPRKRRYVVERRGISTGLRSGYSVAHYFGTASFFDAPPPLPHDPAMRRDVWRYTEYTGEAVAKEISEHWYRTGNFIFDVPHDCLLGKFLTQDVWQRGNVPADIVRYIQVNLTNDRMYGVESPGLVADLEHLLLLTNKATMIVFQLDGSTEETRYTQPPQYPVLQTWLEAVAPCIYRLRAGGFSRIKVYQGVMCRLYEQWPWNKSHRDITNWFDMEEDEFRKVFSRVGRVTLMKLEMCANVWARRVEIVRRVNSGSPTSFRRLVAEESRNYWRCGRWKCIP